MFSHKLLFRLLLLLWVGLNDANVLQRLKLLKLLLSEDDRLPGRRLHDELPGWRRHRRWRRRRRLWRRNRHCRSRKLLTVCQNELTASDRDDRTWRGGDGRGRGGGQAGWKHDWRLRLWCLGRYEALNTRFKVWTLAAVQLVLAFRIIDSCFLLL